MDLTNEDIVKLRGTDKLARTLDRLERFGEDK